MNIADTIFFEMYDLLNNTFDAVFIGIFGNWRQTFFIIITIALVLVGYRMLYSQKADIASHAKHLIVIVLVSIFVLQGDLVYDSLKFIFLDFWVSAGNYTIQGIQGAILSGGGMDLTFNPEEGTKTAFGALWEFATGVADRLFQEASFSNWTPIFGGMAMYVVAVILMIILIVLMATSLILGTACVLGSPVFMWMIMFKPLKPMFEKWLGMGITAGVLLYFLIIMLGIIIAFMANVMSDLVGYNVFSADPTSLADPDYNIDIKKVSTSVLFFGLGMYLLPKTENWATSIGSFSAEGISSGAIALGDMTTKYLASKGSQVLSAPKTIKNELDNYDQQKNVDNSVRQEMLSRRIENAERENPNVSSTDRIQSKNENDPINEGSSDSTFKRISDTDSSDRAVNENASSNANTPERNSKEHTNESLASANDIKSERVIHQKGGEPVQVQNNDHSTTNNKSVDSVSKQSRESQDKERSVERRENHKSNSFEKSGQNVSVNKDHEGTDQPSVQTERTTDQITQKQTIVNKENQSRNKGDNNSESNDTNGSSSSSNEGQTIKRRDSKELKDD